MFTKFLTATIAMAAVPAMFFAAGAQEPARPNTPEPPRVIVSTDQGGQSGISQWTRSSQGVAGIFGLNSTDQQIAAAAKAMRQAETSSARSQAKDRLMLLLSEDYDSRLSEYDAYLQEMEKQLEDMRARLEKRRQAKDEMIDLRIKVLEAEADDLGWPTRVRRNRTFAFPAPATEQLLLRGNVYGRFPDKSNFGSFNKPNSSKASGN